MKKIISFIKKEIVFSISFVVALVSMLFVKPDNKYLSYIDFRTIGLLFALMAVVAGLSKAGLILKLAEKIVEKVGNTRLLVAVLWSICFFTSMIITNDVALITFVPVTISVLSMCNKENLIIYTIVLQTIGANLGSMLTPMGNPQNLYIYTYYNVNIKDFFAITVPIIVVSFLLLLLATLLVKSEKIDVNINKTNVNSKNIVFMYFVLAIVSILAVLRVFDYKIAVIVVALSILIFDRSVIKNIDWLLLLTFCCFFVFVGNISRIDIVNDFIVRLINGREFVVSFCASQVMSNVPATIMLSGFTNNYKGLILGADIGGLGTLVASLASLISFKLYSSINNSQVKRYLLTFTAVNIVFFVILILTMVLFVK